VLREYFESLVVAIVLALFIRTFVVQAFKIPTGSMENNLLIGDHLLVNKVAYSPSSGALERAVLGQRAIERGHIVVFKFPEDPSRDFIKRVVGLPGETVEVRDKQVLIDGRPLDEPYARFDEAPPHPGGFGLRRELLREAFGPRRVPAGQLFVLGDNRDNSRDSRYWGFLPADQVRGRALLVYWSYDATRAEYVREGWANRLRDTLSAFGRTRWERVFHLIR
jgi:signal peptidase I